jgi:hypothetical protein
MPLVHARYIERPFSEQVNTKNTDLVVRATQQAVQIDGQNHVAHLQSSLQRDAL